MPTKHHQVEATSWKLCFALCQSGTAALQYALFDGLVTLEGLAQANVFIDEHAEGEAIHLEVDELLEISSEELDRCSPSLCIPPRH